MTRVCNQCHIERPLDDFANDKNRRDGKSYTCKVCNRARTSAWAKANPKRARERGTQWRIANRQRVRASSRKHYAKNQERILARTKARRAADPNRRATERWKWIYRNYQMTREQWLALFDAQGARCGCCTSTEPGSKLGWHTDHDHRTGVVRGIVCASCNVMLGGARDQIANLTAGIAYLERTR